MESWVGLVGWPIANSLLMYRAGKVRPPNTDVIYHSAAPPTTTIGCRLYNRYTMLLKDCQYFFKNSYWLKWGKWFWTHGAQRTWGGAVATRGDWTSEWWSAGRPCRCTCTSSSPADRLIPIRCPRVRMYNRRSQTTPPRPDLRDVAGWSSPRHSSRTRPSSERRRRRSSRLLSRSRSSERASSWRAADLASSSAHLIEIKPI